MGRLQVLSLAELRQQVGVLPGASAAAPAYLPARTAEISPTVDNAPPRRNDDGRDNVKTAPLLVLLCASVALGLFLGWRYLHRLRNNPVHSAVHLIMGGAGLECMVQLMRGAPDGSVFPAELLGRPAALLMALAMMSGFASPVIGRQFGRKPATAVLIAHAALGAGGFILAMAWLTKS
jgi:hypothetical protein